MVAVGGAANPVIAMDAAGNAIAIWRQSNAAGGVFSIHANRFTAATKTWGAPALLETDDIEGAGDVDLDVDAAGNAVVVWNQLSGRYQSIWSNRLAAGAGAWGSATLVETYDQGESMLPRVAATGGGGAVAVWIQWDGTRQSIHGSRLDAAGGWQTPLPLETSDTVEALNPDVAADGDGNAVAVWEETDGATVINVRAARRDRTTGVWSTPVTLGTPGVYAAGNLAFPRIALDPATGDGVAVWLVRAGTINSVWASRYHRSTGLWDAALPLETDERGHASQPRIAVDGQGNAVAAWRQSDGTRLDIWANRLVASTGTWSGPVRLDVDDGDASLPSVAAAGNGQAVVVWQQRATNLDVRASRFDPAAGTWGAPSLLDTPAAPGENPKVAVSATGLAVAVWSQQVGSAYDLLGAYHPN
jgi:hypothetical protein